MCHLHIYTSDMSLINPHPGLEKHTRRPGKTAKRTEHTLA